MSTPNEGTRQASGGYLAVELSFHSATEGSVFQEVHFETPWFKSSHHGRSWVTGTVGRAQSSGNIYVFVPWHPSAPLGTRANRSSPWPALSSSCCSFQGGIRQMGSEGSWWYTGHWISKQPEAGQAFCPRICQWSRDAWIKGHTGAEGVGVCLLPKEPSSNEYALHLFIVFPWTGAFSNWLS